MRLAERLLPVDEHVEEGHDAEGRKVRHRGVYLLPNLFTTANLFAGFFSIISAVNGRFEIAAVTVFAPAGWLAEAHATATLAAGSDGAIEHLEANGLSGIAVSDSLDDARVFTTGDLAGVALDAGLVAT